MTVTAGNLGDGGRVTEEKTTVDGPRRLARGGWTWFGGSSALSIGNVHLLGLVRRVRRKDRGESCVAVLDQSGRQIRAIPLLKGLTLDDHNVPTIVPLTEEKFVVAVTGHNDTSSVRLALGVVSDGDVRLGPRVNIDFGEPTSYAHVIPEGQESFLLLTRTNGQNFHARRIDASTLEPLSNSMPVFSHHISADDPLWSGRDGNRPYLITRRVDDGVLFALTHDHPRAYRNGVVAGRFRGSAVYDLDDKLVYSVEPNSPTWDPFALLTEIIAPGDLSIPWVQDIAQERSPDNSGAVHVAVSHAVMPESAFRRGVDHVHENLGYKVFRREFAQHPRLVFEASAGPSLYQREEHYAGGIALNPRNPDDILFSTTHVPSRFTPGAVSVSDETLGHERKSINRPVWKLLQSEKSGGQRQSRVLEDGTRTGSMIRPLFTDSVSRVSAHAAFAMSGDYGTYSHFDTRAWPIVFSPEESCWQFKEVHLDLPFPLKIGAGMPPRESAYLRRMLGRTRSYLEYGGGSSTLIAFEKRVTSVVTVETDARLMAILDLMSRHSSSHFRCVGPKLATTFAWGHPAADDEIDNFGREYATAPFTADLTGRDGKARTPRLVLIDGRFRVASALVVASHATHRTVIMIDDYVGRNAYRVVEKFLGKPRLTGRLATFIVRRPVTIPPEVLEAAYRDPS